VPFRDFQDYVERTFRHVADSKDWSSFRSLRAICHGPCTPTPNACNKSSELLSNAFKFTEQGKVSLQVAPANQGWSPDNETLAHAKSSWPFP